MKKGFTLIELWVVVLIIGILSAVALPQYQKAVDRAKGTEALTTSKTLVDALNVYYLENGMYYSGNSFDNLSIEVPELKYFDIGTNNVGGGCTGSSCIFYLGERESVYEEWIGTAQYYRYGTTLTFYLEEGKTISRICTGEKCQNYFGVKDGEEF